MAPSILATVFGCHACQGTRLLTEPVSPVAGVQLVEDFVRPVDLRARRFPCLEEVDREVWGRLVVQLLRVVVIQLIRIAMNTEEISVLKSNP